MVQNPPYRRASSLLFPHWDVKTKRPQSVKLDWPLFLCPSVAIIMSLPASMADFVPCDCLLQKAYCAAHPGLLVGQSRNTSKVRRKKHFYVEEDIHNWKNSQVRVHVERGIRSVKVFRIFEGMNIPLCSSHLLSKS